MKNIPLFTAGSKSPRTHRILNGDQLRADRETAEVVAVMLEETADTIDTDVDFGRYQPRLESYGLCIRERLERLVEAAPVAGQVALETEHACGESPYATIISFPGVARVSVD